MGSPLRGQNDAEFILPHPVVITRTWSYITTAAAKKTILVLDRDDSLVERPRVQGVAAVQAMIIAKYKKDGAVGAAAYDNFPEAVRDTLVRTGRRNWNNWTRRSGIANATSRY